MSDKIREKWIVQETEVADDVCPNCKEKSKEPVFPFGDDSFYCENPLCLVTRFSIAGYYIETLEPIGTPNVQEIQEEMKKKRD